MGNAAGESQFNRRRAAQRGGGRYDPTMNQALWNLPQSVVHCSRRPGGVGWVLKWLLSTRGDLKDRQTNFGWTPRNPPPNL